MAVLVQTVSTGDVIVFDKDTRSLVLIDREHSGKWEAGKSKTFDAAMRFVKQGEAQHYSREQLSKIQAALAGVVLLV